jgi:hypothetical protein
MVPVLPSLFSERSIGMRVAFAEPEDLDYLAREDHHVQRGVIEQKIERREIVVLHHDGWRGEPYAMDSSGTRSPL